MAHYTLEGQHRAMTVFGTKSRQELDELLAGWPRLQTDREVYQLVSVFLKGHDEVEAMLYRMAKRIREGTLRSVPIPASAMLLCEGAFPAASEFEKKLR